MIKKNIIDKAIGDTTTLIARNTELIGTVNFSGELEIEGKVVGDIIAVDEAKARVRILEQGHVEGNIKAPNIVVHGTVKGNIYSTKILELSNKTLIEGNIYYDVIEMSKGARINGSLLYGTDTKSIDNIPKAKIVPQAVQ